MSQLTVFSIVRNAIENGYPFVEAYGSWLGYCDRLFILEGKSSDGTDFVLAELARLDPAVEVVSAPWPQSSKAGSAIAEFTNAALEHIRGGSGYLMYVQADEIYTAPQRRLVRFWERDALEFASYVNFWNSIETIVEQQFQMRPLRLFPANADVRSIGDGFDFELRGTAITRVAEPILHYGWCFPVSILQKHVSHGQLYSDQRPYMLRGRLARMMLDLSTYDRQLLNALLPRYRPVPYEGQHPECMRHLIGAHVYNPYVALDLLRNGAKW